MSGSIPASAIVNVVPSVVSGGGNGLALNGVMLSSNALAPTTATSYASATPISALFGPLAPETLAAQIYFSGFSIGTQTPGQLWIVQALVTSVPATIMNGVLAITTDWVTFFHAFVDTTANLEAYASWSSAQSNRFAFLALDTDVTAITNTMDVGALAKYVATNTLNGICLQWAPLAGIAEGLLQLSFIAGFAASLDFTRTNGRATLAFKETAGLSASVTNETSAQNLIANGYNFFGAYATANQGFIFEYPGQISGPFKWFDSYINQIWLNNAFQLALMELLVNIGSIPYNNVGYALMEAALMDVISEALNFGVFSAGVPPSAAEAAIVNQQAGKVIAPELQNKGWYLQILPAIASVRTARTSPPATFWYMDGGSVQQVTLASIEVQ